MAPAKRNGFLLFTDEWIAKNNADGLCRRTSIEGAQAQWEKLSDEKKKEYNDRAKANNKILKEVAAKKEEEIVKAFSASKGGNTEEKDRLIDILVENASSNESLHTREFFFIAANYFTHVLETDQYVPAEISVSKYSVRKGVIDVYHSIINPGDLPYGYQFKATTFSEDTHYLPLPPNSVGESDLRRIYKCILQFILGDKVPLQFKGSSQLIDIGESLKNTKVPEIYTRTSQMEIVKSVLDYMCSVKQDDATLTGGAMLPLYSIEYLFYKMNIVSAAFGNSTPPKNLFIVDEYFNRDMYEYELGIACKYHEDCDRSKYCSRSYVLRWAYMFSNTMCKDFGITPIPGKHLPSKDRKCVVTTNLRVACSTTVVNLNDDEKKETTSSSVYVYTGEKRNDDENTTVETEPAFAVTDRGQFPSISSTTKAPPAASTSGPLLVSPAISWRNVLTQGSPSVPANTKRTFPSLSGQAGSSVSKPPPRATTEVAKPPQHQLLRRLALAPDDADVSARNSNLQSSVTQILTMPNIDDQNEWRAGTLGVGRGAPVQQTSTSNSAESDWIQVTRGSLRGGRRGRRHSKQP